MHAPSSQARIIRMYDQFYSRCQLRDIHQPWVAKSVLRQKNVTSSCFDPTSPAPTTMYRSAWNALFSCLAHLEKWWWPAASGGMQVYRRETYYWRLILRVYTYDSLLHDVYYSTSLCLSQYPIHKDCMSPSYFLKRFLSKFALTISLAV